MGTIGRYIFKHLVIGVTFVATALLCLLWLTQSLRFIELIVKKGLSPGSFLYMTGLLLPSFTTIITPIALFAVLLFTYNRLMLDRELVVMQSVGLSYWRLARPAVVLSGIGVVLGLILNIFVIPWSVQAFREFQWTIRNDYSNILLREGVFNTITDKLIVYVKERNGEGELMGVLVHDTRDRMKPVTMMAERGALVRSDGNPKVLLINGNRQEVVRGSGRMSILYFDSYTVDLSGIGGEVQDRARDARERPLWELLTVSPRELPNMLEFNRFRIEAHQRLSAPLLHLSFASVALACLLTGGFSRHGQTRPVIAAIALMVAIQAANLGIATLATKFLFLAPLLYANALLPAGIGLAMLIWPPRARKRALPQAA